MRVTNENFHDDKFVYYFAVAIFIVFMAMLLPGCRSRQSSTESVLTTSAAGASIASLFGSTQLLLRDTIIGLHGSGVGDTTERRVRLQLSNNIVTTSRSMERDTVTTSTAQRASSRWLATSVDTYRFPYFLFFTLLVGLIVVVLVLVFHKVFSS